MTDGENPLSGQTPFELIVAWDEALASGSSPAATDAARDSPSQSCLAKQLELLERLNRLRPPRVAAEMLRPEYASELGEQDRYRLIRLHATGGIGRVWLAYDAELDREVALKDLRQERADDPHLVARFLREARVTGQLQHPGIVPVYDVAVRSAASTARESGDASSGTESDQPFYTMRFVQGRSLSEAVHEYHGRRRRGEANSVERIRLLNAFVQICQTVAYANARGIIHRDLKPQNVVLGDFGEVIVVDWGFASLSGIPDVDPSSNPSCVSRSGEGSLTSELSVPSDSRVPADTLDPVAAASCFGDGRVLGTPAYMAPEQVDSHGTTVDRRTDVYGLGAMLYEVLTGQPPFAAADAKSLLKKVRDELPARPKTVCRSVPAPLAAVCIKALAKDPARRYDSAEALGREVQHWLADQPVDAFRDPVWSRVARWGRRHRSLVAGISGLLIACGLAIFMGGLMLADLRTRAAAERATRERRERQQLELQLYHQRLASAEREWSTQNVSSATQLLNACPDTLRGWEWHCLNRLCHTDQLLLRGHKGAVCEVAFSPDGNLVATAGVDYSVRLWDARRGTELFHLGAHRFDATHVAFSPDGSYLLSASLDGELMIWDPKTGQRTRTVATQQQPLFSIMFNPDGSQVAVAGHRAITMWDTKTWQATTFRESQPNPINTVAFSPDGQRFAYGESNGYLEIWDPKKLGEPIKLPHRVPVRFVVFSPDSRRVATASSDEFRHYAAPIEIWDVISKQRILTLHGHADPVWSLAFRPDGLRLASASQDHTVRLWDLETGSEILSLREHGDAVRSVAFGPGPHWPLASAGSDGTVRIWNAAPWENESPPDEIYTFTGHAGRVQGVSFSADGQRLASIGNDNTVRIWDTISGQQLTVHSTGTMRGLVIDFSADGSRLAWTLDDGTIVLADAHSGNIIKQLDSPLTAHVQAMEFGPDSRSLVSAGSDHMIHIWNTDTVEVRSILAHGSALMAVAFNSDGTRLASASNDRTVKVWSVADGRELHRFADDTNEVFGVDFSADGGLLAGTGSDSLVRIWSTDSWQLLHSLSGHKGAIFSVAFSPTESLLATAGSDWSIKLWDPQRGSLVHTFRGHTDRIQSITFSPDGRQLASASDDHTIKLWKVPVTAEASR